MSEIKIINSADIDTSNAIIYFGWTETDIKNYKINHQTIFVGFAEDTLLEVTTADMQVYYAVFRSGESQKNQRQCLLVDNTHNVLVNANGIIYRFDSIQRKCLDTDCYNDIEINSTYFATDISPELSLMTVIDNEGVAVINWSGVLWKKDFDYANADYLNVTAITQKNISITYEPPGEEIQYIKLDTYTGALL